MKLKYSNVRVHACVRACRRLGLLNISPVQGPENCLQAATHQPFICAQSHTVCSAFIVPSLSSSGRYGDRYVKPATKTTVACAKLNELQMTHTSRFLALNSFTCLPGLSTCCFHKD